METLWVSYSWGRGRLKSPSQGKIDLDEGDIRALLVSRTRSVQSELNPTSYIHTELINPRQAAVLIPFFFSGGEWHILLTRRTDSVQDHKGQVAFPGGATENEDASPENTALRETYEEIGLKASDVRILGQLDALITGTGYLITPVVGVIPWPYPFIISVDEVSRIFSIPLRWLAEPDHYEERIYSRSENDPVPHLVIFFDQYDGEILWGVSARIIVNLLTALHLIQPAH